MIILCLDVFFTVFIRQRIEELKLYLSLELYDDEDELLRTKRELKDLIQNKLTMYDLCDTSTDDEQQSTITKIVHKKKTEVKESLPNVKARLPGVTEKWNEDLSDHEAQCAKTNSDDEELFYEEIDVEDVEEEEDQREDDSVPLVSREEAVDEDNDNEEDTYDHTDPYENIPDITEDAMEEETQRSVFDSSDSEGEGEVIIENKGLDTSISSRNSGGSKRSSQSFSCPDTQFTAEENIILSSILNNTPTHVPISRKFISGKSKEADVETPKKTLSKNITRSSQLTIPLEKEVNPILKKPRKQKTAAKKVLEEKTEEEDAYSWDTNARKKLPRTR